ncbi:hypothetical protein CJ030_MR4G024559 [Morella rubra]|uniref:Uncharacterized protein n=1 Tax=Morella rubra TaxID=262757 RepID=A0A6A1VVE1_9ROSI|nr:hypothetical protein CJ030_MR4G024559 [Morella rubra]
MDGFISGGSIEEPPKSQDLRQLGDNQKERWDFLYVFFRNAEGAVFDASQYAFFGKDVVEEVELGGLEDEELSLPAVGTDEEEFLYNREEGEDLRSLSDIDDLASTFSKVRLLKIDNHYDGTEDGTV